MQHLVVMGVAGSGKSTLARLLNERLGWAFAEADDFHPPANVAKMAAGIPLDDADRAPWLASLRDWLTDQARAGRSTIATCSALKRAYREVLRGAQGRVRFVHLNAPATLLEARIGGRSGHFMPASLLPSQLATLEPLTADEDGLTLAADADPQAAERVLSWLGAGSPRPSSS